MQNKIAACSGGAGDILYSIPVMRKLGVGTYYIKRNFYHPPHTDLYETMRLIIEKQSFTCLPTSGAYVWGQYEPGLQYDYDIDSFRNMPMRNRVHIMRNMCLRFHVSPRGIETPWLTVTATEAPDNLIHLTPRWRENSAVEWREVRDRMQGTQAFIGFQYEWIDFCQKYGNIEWLPTNNIWDMAQLVAGCKRLWCNQSVALVIAQGIGKEYHLERKPMKTNTLLHTKNEYLL